MGWRLVALTAFVMSFGAVILMTWHDGDVDSIRLLIRLTARVSLGFFCLAFSATAVNRIWPNVWTRWQVANRRYLGLSFAVSHFIHAVAISIFIGRYAAQFHEVHPGSNVPGGIGYVFLLAMTVTSFDRTAALVGPRIWRALHASGAYVLWTIFVISEVSRVRDDRIHLWFVAPLLLAAAIRILAWWRSRAGTSNGQAADLLTAAEFKLTTARSYLRSSMSKAIHSKSASRSIILPLVFASFLLGGCANMSNHSSGFLGNYGHLKPDPKDSHRLVYEQTDWKKSEYTGVLIEPVVVRLRAEDESKITAKEITDLAAYSEAALRKALGKEWKIVTVAEPGTLRVRSAITGIDTSDPVLNVLTSLVLCPVDNGGVSMEFEVRDAANGDQLVALAGFSTGTPLEGLWAFTRFGQAHWGIDHWSVELRKIAHPIVTKVATK